MRARRFVTAVLVASAVLVGGRPFHAQGSFAYTEPQIEQMVAPIALYPDALVSQVLMAATFPDQVADADQWMQANPGLAGGQLDDALSTATWDPSVISLCKFPSLLDRMARNVRWTTDLGYAFQGQRGQVMGAIQQLRRESYDAGYLRSTPQQSVVVEPSYIAIQPYNPAVVYVPVYNPAVVYGPGWAYPAPYYASVWAPSPGVSFVNGFAWGLGFWVGHALFGGCDWGHRDVYVNNTVIVNNVIYHNTPYYRNREWEHGEHRGWVRHAEEARDEGWRMAPYGGEGHGAVHGVPPGQLRREGGPPPGQLRKEGGLPPGQLKKEGEPYRPSYKAPYGREENPGHGGAVHPPQGEPYRYEGNVAHPPTAAPREGYPGVVHPQHGGEYGHPGEKMHEKAPQVEHPPKAEEHGHKQDEKRKEENR